MAQSELDVVNGALIKLGTDTVVALDNSSVESKVGTNSIEKVRRGLLRLHPWNFAINRAKLELTTPEDVTANSDLIEITATAHGLATNDYVTVHGVDGVTAANGRWKITWVDNDNFTLNTSVFVGTYTSGTGTWGKAPAFGQSYLHAVPSNMLRLLILNRYDNHPEWKLEGGFIATDLETVEINFIQDITDYTLMDSMFYQALSYLVAIEVCDRVTEHMGKKDRLVREYEKLIAKARFVDATEDSLEKIEASDWVESRFNVVPHYVRDPMT